MLGHVLIISGKRSLAVEEKENGKMALPCHDLSRLISLHRVMGQGLEVSNHWGVDKENCLLIGLKGPFYG
jgi:hypothetical protein